MLYVGVRILKSSPIIFVVVFCLTSDVSLANATFTHPGLLNSMEELDVFHDKINQQQEPWTSSYNSIPNYLNHTPQPMAQYVDKCSWDPVDNPHRIQLHNSSEAVYGVALQWAATRNPIYADKAIEIINAWSSTLQGVSSMPIPPKIYCQGHKLYMGAEFPE